MTYRVGAFWCRIPSRSNFGDALTPWLIKKFTGQHPVFRDSDSKEHKYMITGSIISYAGKNCTVWGAGIMNFSERLGQGAKLLAVRGPLSRRSALKSNLDCPEIYGDPALLLPRFYTAKRSAVCDVGIVLHFSDHARLSGRHLINKQFKLIDIQQPIEDVIDQISSCELIASTSLHGIIVAHAYGIPAVWMEFRPLPSGDGSKFKDYFASLDLHNVEPLVIDPQQISKQFLQHYAIPPKLDFDLGPLWKSCPFREK